MINYNTSAQIPIVPCPLSPVNITTTLSPSQNARLACLVPDPTYETIITALAILVQTQNSIVIGHADVLLDGASSHCRYTECTAGDFVTNAMRQWLLQRPGTGARCDIAFTNAGAIRSSIPAGNITAASINTMVPFADSYVSFSVSGVVLVQILQQSVASYSTGSGQFLQIDGVTFTFNPSFSPGQRIITAQARNSDGSFSDILPNQVYSVCTNSYISNGGNGYSMIPGNMLNVFNFGPTIGQVVIDYVTSTYNITAALDGRIALTNSSVSLVEANICSYTQTVNNMTQTLVDRCFGQPRISTSFTWMITPTSNKTGARVIELQIFPLILYPSDQVIILDVTTQSPPVLTSGDSFGSAYYVRNLATVQTTFFLLSSGIQIQFVSSSVNSQRELSASYTAQLTCPDGFEPNPPTARLAAYNINLAPISANLLSAYQKATCIL